MFSEHPFCVRPELCPGDSGRGQGQAVTVPRDGKCYRVSHPRQPVHMAGVNGVAVVRDDVTVVLETFPGGAGRDVALLWAMGGFS